MRPCTCERQQGGKFDISRDCRPCYLFHSSPRYNALWGGSGVIKADGSVAPKPAPSLSEATVKELFGDEAAESDPTLLGNRIAALTSALGFPPCGGCSKRKEWLNAAHAWLQGG